MTQGAAERLSAEPTMPDPPADASIRLRKVRPAVAGLLSFVWPGLGQAYRGDRRLALLFAVPPALVVLLGAAFIATLGPYVVVAHLFNPVISFALIGVVAALALWRVASIAEAGEMSRRRPWRTSLIVAVIGVVAVTHGWLGYNLWSFYVAGQEIYEPIIHAGPAPTHAVSPGPSPSGSSPPVAVPSARLDEPSPLPGRYDRVTILLVGVDNTHTREFGLTDTLIVASFDPLTDSLVMISLPRDTARLPYYAGGEWRPRINTLMQSAARSPQDFADGPMGTLVRQMSYLVGIPIDYYAQIDISGFTRLIDMVGGVTINVDRAVNDPQYQFSPDEVGFHIDPGIHHLDGKIATAYARSRRGSSDYDRARRQQQVLVALRSKLNDATVLANLPGFTDAISDMIRTDAPLERLPEIVSIAQRTQDASTRNLILSPPKYAQSVFSEAGDRTFQIELKMDAVAELSIELFGEASRYYAQESE